MQAFDNGLYFVWWPVKDSSTHAWFLIRVNNGHAWFVEAPNSGVKVKIKSVRESHFIRVREPQHSPHAHLMVDEKVSEK